MPNNCFQFEIVHSHIRSSSGYVFVGFMNDVSSHQTATKVESCFADRPLVQVPSDSCSARIVRKAKS